MGFVTKYVLRVFNCCSNLFGYSTKTCKCLFHEDTALYQKLVASVDIKDIWRATFLNPDFVNDPLPCVHRRQNRHCPFMGQAGYGPEFKWGYEFVVMGMGRPGL